MYRFRPHRRGATIAGLAAAAFALVTIVACSDDEPDSIARPPTTTVVDRLSTTTDRTAQATTTAKPTTTKPAAGTSSTARPPTSEEQLVIDRYLAFWDARWAANAASPNPDDPRLPDVATGRQLVNVIAETRDRRDQGLAIREAQPSVGQTRVRVRELDGDVAKLQECSVNDGIIYRPATGEVVNSEVVTRNAEATMRKVDGTWRLEMTKVLQEWKGVAGCALAEDF